MAIFQPLDPDFEARVRDSFGQLTLMKTLGASLARVAPGEVDIELPFQKELTQHHGFISAAILTAIVDTACGYAAMTLMPPGTSVVTVEYKLNFLAPARGDCMIGRGRVTRAGRTLTVCHGDVVARDNGTEELVAAMQGTMMTVADFRGDRSR